MKYFICVLVVWQVGVVFSQDAKYVGCYIDSSVRDLAPYINNVGAGNKVQTCFATCKSEGYKYAGLQASTWCLCGNTVGRYGKVADVECSMACPGEITQKCGAGLRNSVYTTGYKGCYRDSVTRAMNNIFVDIGRANTVNRCIDLCKKAKFRYAGMQYASQCFCDNEYALYGEAPDSECGANCPGNTNQKCGGTWRNSVYSTQTPTDY